jgi:hypothetical protein
MGKKNITHFGSQALCTKVARAAGTGWSCPTACGCTSKRTSCGPPIQRCLGGVIVTRVTALLAGAGETRSFSFSNSKRWDSSPSRAVRSTSTGELALFLTVTVNVALRRPAPFCGRMSVVNSVNGPMTSVPCPAPTRAPPWALDLATSWNCQGRASASGARGGFSSMVTSCS